MIAWIAAFLWSLTALLFAIDAGATAGAVVCAIGCVINALGLFVSWRDSKAVTP